MKKPEQLKNPDFTALVKACQEYVDFMDDDEEYCEDCIDDYMHEIEEKALEAVFGKDFWDWNNTRQP
jgi:wobble nucleotide-excising tRNase